MDEDTLVVVLVVFGIGVAAWLLLRGKPAAAPPPCNVNVSYSGVGVGVPCGAIKEVAADLAKAPTSVLKPVTTGLSKTLGFGTTVTPEQRSSMCADQSSESWGGRMEKAGMCESVPTTPTTTVRTAEQQASTINRFLTGTRVVKV